MRIALVFIFILSLAFNGQSQNQAIGTWNVHVPYQSCVDIAVAGEYVWGALEASVIRVDAEDFSITRFTKASGLSDVEVAAIGHDDATGNTIIAYNNANIDIISGNTITNLPDIKNALITGDKTINTIFTYNGYAWLAAGFGIVKINMQDKEISDTYFVGPGNSNLQINDIWVNDSYIFAASQDGVIRGTISPFINLSNADDEQAWLRYTFEDNGIPEDNMEVIDELDGSMYAFMEDELFQLAEGDDSWQTVDIESNWHTVGSRSKNGLIYVAQVFLNGGNIEEARLGVFDGIEFEFWDDMSQVSRPQNIDVQDNGTGWYADLFAGMIGIPNFNFTKFVPNGPYKRTVFDMAWYDGAMYVASSSLNPSLPANYPSLPYGFYESRDQFWTNYNEFNIPGLAGMEDIATIEPIPSEHKLLIGAHFNGLIEFDLNDNSTEIFEKPPDENNAYRTIAMISDQSGNIWMPNAGASAAPLICRKKNGGYIYFTAKTASILNKPLNSIAIDEFNQIWLSTAGSGLYVYNYNGTLEDQSDDILKSVGSVFNLPSVDVRCVTAEQDGEIWIGTSAGVGVVFCPGAILNNSCIVDRICIPRQDTTNFCDNLLENEIVNCITIDPGNRKWIGTNSGVFLQSSDGLETIYHFTEDNSPLLSNNVRSIAVNPDNGDVFFGTEKGINTFRNDATHTETTGSDAPYVYPNPVRPDYRGPIAIRNLPNNANVKIVDVAGHLVYETESEGGQAVWDGRDVHGDRVHSGVYIVLSADDDGKFKRTAKFVYIH